MPSKDISPCKGLGYYYCTSHTAFVYIGQITYLSNPNFHNSLHTGYVLFTATVGADAVITQTGRATLSIPSLSNYR